MWAGAAGVVAAENMAAQMPSEENMAAKLAHNYASGQAVAGRVADNVAKD